MRLRYTRRFRDQYQSAPQEVQKAFDKQVRLLAENFRHPSLRAKKYDESQDVWQARVTQRWRLYFKIEGDTYVILSMIPHPK